MPMMIGGMRSTYPSWTRLWPPFTFSSTRSSRIPPMRTTESGNGSRLLRQKDLHGTPRPISILWDDHLDDEGGLNYKVTRIDKVKGYIVAYQRLVTPRASDTREELVPVHIADICRILVQSRKASVATPDGDSRPARLSGLVRSENPMWTPVQAGIGSMPLERSRREFNSR
jgi:hypothetical protein